MPDEPTLHFESDEGLGEDFIEFVRVSRTVRAKQMEVPFTCLTIDGNVASGKPGDYVVVDAKGFPYPCEREIFESTHATHPDAAHRGESMVDERENGLLRRPSLGLDSAR